MFPIYAINNLLGQRATPSTDPADIPSISLRYKSSGGVNSAAGKVSGWIDLISGIQVSQITGALQPSLISNSLNGFPSIQFINQYLRVPGGLSFLEGKTGMTIFMLSAGSTPGPYSTVGGGMINYQDQDAILSKSTALQGNANNVLISFNCNGSNVQNSVNSLGNQWSVKSCVIDSTLASGQRLKIYDNGNLKFSGNAPTTFTSVSNPELLIGAFSLSGSYTTTDGSIVEILIYNRALTAAELLTVNNYFFSTYGLSKKRLICDGNSLTYGTASTGGSNYPQQLAILLGSDWLVYNTGIQGILTATMVTSGPTRIDNEILSPYFSKNIVLAWEGTNSLNAGVDATTAYNSMVAYCTARKAAGASVIVATVLPRSSAGVPADFNAQRAAYNALVVANGLTFADRVFDIAANATIGPDGAELNTTYYAGDRVHLINAGYAIVANAALPIIQSL